MSRFGTLDDLKKKGKKQDEDDSNDDTTNTYYAGGARGQGGGSGLNVVAPPNGGEEDGVQRILARAHREGQNQAPPPGQDVVEVVFYRNGFTVGGGPLRERGVPLNDQFIDDVSQGICPRELVKDGQPQNIKLSDKRSEDYVPPSYTAFSGSGNAIGGERRAADDEVINIDEFQDGLKAAELMDMETKDKKVTVMVAFPAPRKGRQKFQFLRSHTVNDLASVISSCDKLAQGNFTMLKPSKEPIKRSDFGLTLPEAKLENALVTVSYR